MQSKNIKSVLLCQIGCNALGMLSYVLLAAILCAIALIQKKPSNYHIAILLNGAVWLVYDMAIGAYAMLASHGITVIAALIGIVRLDVLKKEK